MSKLFFDHLLVLDEVEVEIKRSASSREEREELWGLVDDIVNPKVFETILNKLPREHHEEFVEIFHKCPYDEEVIFGYLKAKTGQNLEEELRKELEGIGADILKELRPQDEVTAETKVSNK